METVSFLDDGVHFKNYAIIPASVFPHGSVSWTDLKEADPDCWPPELRLKSGEILFISAEKKEALAIACLRHKIPLAPREDIWGLLLEPFLDTEFTKDEQLQTNQRLIQCGFSKSEIEAIRTKLEKKMLFYNSFAWEWIHLGLYDLFAAQGLISRARLASISSHWRVAHKQKIYWWAMEIANRKLL